MRSDNLRSAPRWITPDMVGRILALAMPVGGEPVPVVQVPTRGVKPRLAIVQTHTEHQPVERVRQAEEREAGFRGPTSPASPQRPSHQPTMAEKAATSERQRIDQVQRHLGNLAAHAARRSASAAAAIEAERPLFRIAFDRGISIADLARTLGQKQSIVSLHTRMAGFVFGRRPLLADPLTLDQLLALADPAVPLPELHSVRAKRERLQKWAKYKRDQRADDVARRKAERAAAAEQRKAQREAAAIQRRNERQATTDKARGLREAERMARRAAKAAPKIRVICEDERGAERQSVRSAPSRELAPASLAPAHPGQPLPAAARAQSIVVRHTPGAAHYLSYAERMNAAVGHLRARNFVVQRHNRDDIIARWHISGWTGLFSNEQLVALAIHHGLELAA